MAERDLLLVTSHFPPSAASGSFRLLGLARHLPKFGWRPVVVAPRTLPWEPVDENLLKQVPAEVTVINAPYPQGWLARLGRKLFGAEAAWLPVGLRAARKAARDFRPAAVLTSGPPHCTHLIGAALKRRGLAWVADFRDPWVPHGPVGKTGSPVNGWVVRGERMVMRRADWVVSNAPLACQFLREAYPEHRDKIVTVTNGFDPERLEWVPPPAEGPVTVLHPGELYLGRDPRPFLDALRLLCSNPSASPRPVRASFLGRNTAGTFDLGAEVRQRGLEGVVSLGGQVAYDQSLRQMVEGSVLLLLDSPGRRIGVPAKLYEYLGARRPILALAEPNSDTAWVLRESGVPHRLVPPPGNPAAIAQALVELVGELGAGNVAAPPPQLARFTREHMAQQVAGLLERTLGQVKPSRAPLRGAQSENVQVS